MAKLTKLGWDRAFKKEGKIFVKPHRDMARIAKFFKKEGIRKILDLGCGSGRHLVYLAKRGFDAYGIDIARHGIKIARDWLKKERLKANLEIGDIYKKLPYRDNFFDAIIGIKTLHHEKIENIRKLIKEVKRILKPGGLIFITGHRKPPKKKIPKEKLYGIKYIAPRTYATLAGPEKGMPHYIFNEKILKKEFKGFEISDLWIDDKGDYCLLGKLKKQSSIMIKTIVIDLGGVYFENGTKIALPKIYKLVNVPKEKVDEIFCGYPHKEGWLYRRGKISKKKFWKAAVKKLKINKKMVSKLQEIWNSSYKPIKGVKEIVAKLRKNYKVIAFSGTTKERTEYQNKKYGLLKDFDDFVLSFEVGFTKREIEFYKILLKRLGKMKCKPEECILIDDTKMVLGIAKSFGLKTILFKNPKQLKSDLWKLGVKI